MKKHSADSADSFESDKAWIGVNVKIFSVTCVSLAVVKFLFPGQDIVGLNAMSYKNIFDKFCIFYKI